MFPTSRNPRLLVLLLALLTFFGLWVQLRTIRNRVRDSAAASKSAAGDDESVSPFLLRMQGKIKSQQSQSKTSPETTESLAVRVETRADSNTDLLIENKKNSADLVIAYCTYVQIERRYDPLGHSEFFAHFFGPHVFPEKNVIYRPCVAVPKHLPADILPSSPEGLRQLGLSEDVDIRICSFGATEIVKTLTAVPGVMLGKVSIAEAQERLKRQNLWWTNVSREEVPENFEQWSHSGRIYWPQGSISIPVNATTKRPFGPFFGRHNKEPWFESVAGVSSQFDTKRVRLSVNSITLYHPMVLDTMSWRLTAVKYPNHWSSRVGKPRRSAANIKDALTRPDNFNATAIRESKKFFAVAVNSHCAGPGAYLRSVTIRELFAFSLVKLLNTSVHMPGGCPVRDRWRAGTPDPDFHRRGGLSAVDLMALHRFAIVFENSATSGYFTEKIVNAYLAETIPIYFGPPRAQVEKVFNTKAFIHCDLPQNLTSNRFLHGVVDSQCQNVSKISMECYKLYETEVDRLLAPHYADCVQRVKEIDADRAKYDEMLAQPLVNLDDQGELTGIWDAKVMGKIVRVAMAAFGYV